MCSMLLLSICNHLSALSFMLKRGKSCKKTEVPLHLISPKQLVSECLDLTASLLKEIIFVYTNNVHQQCPFLLSKADLPTLISFILDHNYYDRIIEQFVLDREEQMSKKQFLRCWLYEMKSIRNAWAHWTTERFDYRLASRAFDTLSLVYLGFNGNPENDLYRKIEMDRNKVLLASLKEIDTSRKRK